MTDPSPDHPPMPTTDAVYAALQAVNDPELHRDLVTLGRVRHVELTPDGTAREIGRASCRERV